ncbi:MAG: hypothetical protein ACT4ON_02555 [Bacteroidota bacterium]
MSHQSEAILEKNLIKQLIGLGYEIAGIYDGEMLVSNLKKQLEFFNKTKFAAKEFDTILGDRPSILKAREIGERIIRKMKEYVEVFVRGMVG